MSEFEYFPPPQSDVIMSKILWVEDYKKLSTLYNTEESNLLKSYLQNDYHLCKIYKTLLFDEIDGEKKNFKQIEKQLKFSINEAYSFFGNHRITRNDSVNFQNKITKIENLIDKVRSDFKNKFDSLLQEETDLEQELDNLDENFMQEFSKEQEDKLRSYYNNRIDNMNNKDDEIEMLNQMNKNIESNLKQMENYSILNENKKLDLLFKKQKNNDNSKDNNTSNYINNNANNNNLNNNNQNNNAYNNNTNNNNQSDNTNNNINNKNNDDNSYENLDILDKYLSSILTSTSLLTPMFCDPNSPNYISFSSVEKLINKMTENHLTLIKSKIDIINAIIDRKLGGRNVGWQPKEHEEFLKLRTSFNNKINSYDFLTVLGNTIPYIPLSELKNHIRQFEKYSQIVEIKKLLVAKYKEIKQDIEQKNQQKRLEDLNKEKKSNEMKRNKSKQHLQEMAIKKRQKLQEWKQKKIEEEKENKQKEIENEKQRKEKERMNYLKNKVKNEILIENYKKKKEEEENEKKKMSTIKANYNADYVSKFDIERIKERESKILEKKLNSKRLKSANNIKCEINYQKFKMKENEKLKNVKSKLNEATAGFKEKQREKFNRDYDQPKIGYTMANNILGRTAKAFPVWRKGL